MMQVKNLGPQFGKHLLIKGGSMKEYRDDAGILWHECSGYIDEFGQHHDCQKTIKIKQITCDECRRKMVSVYNRLYYLRKIKPNRAKPKSVSK